MDAVQLLIKATAVLFVVSSMLSIGLATPRAQIFAPMRRPVWALRALAANFVLAPALSVAIVRVLPLDPGYELGLLLLAFAAGSPMLPKLAEAGRTDVASATSLMILLMTASVVIMPLALPLLAKGTQVSTWQIAAPLVILMLAPLALGMAWRHVSPQTGARLQPAVTKLSERRLHRRDDPDLRREPRRTCRRALYWRHRRGSSLCGAAVRGGLGGRRTQSRCASPARICNQRAQHRRGAGRRRLRCR